jgi:hypothetical protein
MLRIINTLQVFAALDADRFSGSISGIRINVQAFISPDKLHTAAFLSCLSGLAYRSDGDLAAELEVKGMHLVASGRNMYTRQEFHIEHASKTLL